MLSLIALFQQAQSQVNQLTYNELEVHYSSAWTYQNLQLIPVRFKNPAVSQSFQVSGVPTLILFKNGQTLWRQSGVVPAKQLQSIIQQKAFA